MRDIWGVGLLSQILLLSCGADAATTSSPTTIIPNYKFAEDGIYDFQLDLHHDTISENHSISFSWVQPVNGYLHGKLVYTSTSPIEWMSLGTSKISIGSHASTSKVMIGKVNSSNTYPLYQHAYPSTSAIQEQLQQLESLQKLPDISQNYIQQYQKGDRFITSLRFNQKVTDLDLVHGENLFLFGLGNLESTINSSSSSIVRQPSVTSVFKLDFDQVFALSRNYKDTPIGCYSDYEGFDYMMILPINIRFYWRVEKDHQHPLGEDDVVHMQMKIPYESWLAFGTSPNGMMLNSQVIIGSNATTTPIKYEIKGLSSDKIIPMGEDRQSIISSSFEAKNGESILRFTKLLKEPKNDEHEIYTATKNTFVYAIGNEDETHLERHRYARSYHFALDSCPITTPEEKVDEREHDASLTSFLVRPIWIAHGFAAFAAFGLCIPIVTSTSLLRLALPNHWKGIHELANVLAAFFAWAAVVMAFTMTGWENHKHMSEKHHIMGLVVTLLMTFQIALGLCSKTSADFIPSDLVRDLRNRQNETIRRIYDLLGYSTCVLGFYQVSTGFTMYAEKYGTRNWNFIYLVFVALVVSSVTIFKFYLHMFEAEIVRERRKGTKNPESPSSSKFVGHELL